MARRLGGGGWRGLQLAKHLLDWQIEVQWFTLTPFFALTGKNPEQDVAATQRLAADIWIVPGSWYCINEKFYLFISLSVSLMAVPHNVTSVLRAPSARKHPSCFHSHGSPALLTLTSAFMWPSSEANLRAHNMFLNQRLGTDEALARIWRCGGFSGY